MYHPDGKAVRVGGRSCIAALAKRGRQRNRVRGQRLSLSANDSPGCRRSHQGGIAARTPPRIEIEVKEIGKKNLEIISGALNERLASSPTSPSRQHGAARGITQMAYRGRINCILFLFMWVRERRRRSLLSLHRLSSADVHTSI